MNNFVYFGFTDLSFLVALVLILTKYTAYSQMVSYSGNILGIQNQVIPFSVLSIRWNKLQSQLVTTVMNDSFQFTPGHYKLNLLWLALSFLLYKVASCELSLR